EATAKKIVPLAHRLKAKKYIGIDVSGDCLNWAKESIDKYLPNLSFQSFKNDFYEDDFPLQPEGVAIGCMFGQTIFNLPINPFDLRAPDRFTIQRLKKFRKLLMPNAYLLIAQDCNQNGEDIKKAYVEAQNFNLNLLYRIERD